jgi:hypothetical protein
MRIVVFAANGPSVPAGKLQLGVDRATTAGLARVTFSPQARPGSDLGTSLTRGTLDE